MQAQVYLEDLSILQWFSASGHEAQAMQEVGCLQGDKANVFASDVMHTLREVSEIGVSGLVADRVEVSFQNVTNVGETGNAVGSIRLEIESIALMQKEEK